MNEANFNYENEFKYLLNRKILSRDEFLELLGQVKSVMERYHNSFSTLAQIEESERLTEDDIYEILITQLPMRVYLSIPHHKLKEIATSIYEAQRAKNERGEK